MAEPGPARAERRAAAEPSPRRRFLTFYVDGQRYALPAETIAEVISVPPVARLPRSPKCLMGLANLRGTVIPVIDARAMLRREAAVLGHAARAIVLAGAAPIALAVDAADRLVSVDPERVATSQIKPAAEPGEILLGAFQMDRRPRIRTSPEFSICPPC